MRPYIPAVSTTPNPGPSELVYSRPMATIVESSVTGQRYVVVGSGFGMSQQTNPHWLLGNAAPVTKKGTESVICVADEDGQIGWLESSVLRVVSIDGVSPKSVLSPQDTVSE